MLDQIAMLEEQLGAGPEGLASSMKNIDWDNFKQSSQKNILSLSQSGKAKADRENLARSQSNFVRKNRGTGALPQVSEELEEDDEYNRDSDIITPKQERQLAMSMKQMRTKSKTGTDNFMKQVEEEKNESSEAHESTNMLDQIAVAE